MPDLSIEGLAVCLDLWASPLSFWGLSLSADPLISEKVALGTPSALF